MTDTTKFDEAPLGTKVAAYVLFGIPLGIIATVFDMFFGGVCTMLLWNWFVSPLGVVLISLPLAMGLYTLSVYFNVFPHSNNQDEHLKSLWYKWGTYAICLLAGWIIHFWVPTHMVVYGIKT